METAEGTRTYSKDAHRVILERHSSWIVARLKSLKKINTIIEAEERNMSRIPLVKMELKIRLAAY